MLMNIKIASNESTYKTADLALATIISLSYPIEAIDRQNPRKSIFLFKLEEGLNALIESYWRGEIKVEPQLLFAQLRAVKSRLYGSD